MNKTRTIRILSACTAFLLVWSASAQTRTLRIVTYNIAADTGGYSTARAGLITPSGGGTVQQGGVLEGIGEENLGSDPAQPIDILALQETTSNPTTVVPIVNGLNTYYNAPGMYSNSTYQATESGGSPTSGNGPNAVIYNTTTVQLVASVPVDPPGGTSKLGSASGEYREVMRYEFAPAGVTPTAANEFYIYVSHYKASTGTQNEAYRAQEAQIIRNDSATLPSNARILWVGDYNVTTSSEAGYQTIIGPGVNQGIDPMNPSGATGITWETATLMNLKTESGTNLRYRDDLQIMTTNVYYGLAGGLALVPGTYHVFGNNGTTPYQGSVGSGNSALTNLVTGAPISASVLYADLTTASDHLPVVADYTIPISAPSMAVSPADSFDSTGTQGGPFSPSSQTYTLTNSGSGSLNWTGTMTADWLTLSATGGTLAAGATTNVTVSINANANSLAVNLYGDAVAFINANNGVGNTARAVSLTVNPTPAQLAVGPSSGFSPNGYVGGPFSPPDETYSVTNLGGTTLSWTASITATWLTLSVAGGTLAAGATTNVTVSVNANANGLPANAYSDTVSFVNTINGIGNTTRPVSLAINSTPPVADFTFGPTNGTAPLSVSFTNLSTGATDYSWSFGDGNTSTLTDTANTYTNPGTYSVSLTAVGPGGSNTLTLANYIVAVNPPPHSGLQLVDFSVSAASGCQFTVTNADGTPVTEEQQSRIAIYSATDPSLALTDWTALTNSTLLTNGLLQVNDTNSALYPQRFYRAVVTP